MFDPRTFGSYNVNDHPKMLHFQYKGSEDVFRYVLVERMPVGDINSASRRKEGEGRDEAEIVKKYIGKKDDGKREIKSTGLQGNVCDGTRPKSAEVPKELHKAKREPKPVRRKRKNRSSNDDEKRG
jgi:hypothetical protein